LGDGLVRDFVSKAKSHGSKILESQARTPPEERRRRWNQDSLAYAKKPKKIAHS
jgi:hypothetical protein